MIYAAFALGSNHYFPGCRGFPLGFSRVFFVEKIDVFIPRFVPSAKTDSIILLIRGRS